MKRFKSFLVALAFIFAGVLAFSLVSNTKVNAETTSFDFSGGTFNTTDKTITWTDDLLTIVQNKGTNASTYPNSSYISAPRWYAGHLVTFSSANNASITSMAITCTSANYATALKDSTWSDGSVTVESTVVTWTGDSNSFTVSLGAKSFISSLSYTYSGTVIPTSVAIDESLELSIGESKTLTATVLPTTAENKSVTWTSLNPSIATVDANGKVTAVSEGTTTIEVISNYNNALKDTCTVEVVSKAEYNSFKQLDLQEQLAFNYKYEAEWLPETTITNNGKCYIGLVSKDGVSLLNAETTKGFSATNSFDGALEFTFVATSTQGYYLIMENSKYLSNANTVNIVRNDTLDETNEQYLWSLDAETGKIVNKSSSRYLGFVNTNYEEVRCYTGSSNTIATIIPTNGEVAFKDAANNENKVTMRIGYTISKELYNSLEALGTTVNFGVRLNDTTNVECTKVELDENNYRLFVAVNNIPLTSIDTVLTACGYVSVDGVFAYTTDVNEYSVRTLAVEYLTNHATDTAVIAANYPLYYLAYYA